ncbi:FAD:protein FMN transferase [Sinomonas susongensis]|uniref:FAD:protein FMN transferase n=1 Tax=Sinomonas susongensis TaxID=1324851 RepID=UPI001BB2953B|nr:FAD:protein FMN transferase [Sinomonas susongensis]
MPASSDFEAFTCACRLAVADEDVLEPALECLRSFVAQVDEACSRFRPDSELSRLQRAGGGVASPLLASLIRTALDAAERSNGDVTPTLGNELADLGYGPRVEGGIIERVLPSESWRAVRVDDDGVLTLPPGVALDLGATAKAAAADSAAREIHERWGTSVLVSLGGDLATAGPDAWEVFVQDLPGDPCTQVRLGGGWAMATSSTQKRRWRSGALELHHILDPRTSLPAERVWRSVSVAAPDCVSANLASTAAIVRGERALPWLRALGYPSWLVREDGRVLELNGWPVEPRPRGLVSPA